MTNRKEDIEEAADELAGMPTDYGHGFIAGAKWADAFPAYRYPPSLNEAKEVWTDAHALWVTSAKFPDEPQASVAYCYAVATLRLLERRARNTER